MDPLPAHFLLVPIKSISILVLDIKQSSTKIKL